MAKSPLIRCFGLVVLATAWLTACGGGGTPAAAPSSAAAAEQSVQPSGTASEAPRKAVRKVKLEVIGKGKAAQPIIYNADESGVESDATLPWSRTAEIELTGAEQEVGRLVSIVSGSVRGADGQFKPAPCRITVDGRRVATGKGSCKYMLK
ncbi:hypothetical protein [Nonomuraea sp. LPB2021202275-12-8]|uniref:hypothetical protein n=1 Tax=Nonomuraea sp. LPB2021202275-12-8 TaxID=3120159 RepID=UPI00300CFAF6